MTERDEDNGQRFLVYATGLPESGQELSANEVQDSLVAGRLNAGDLVWLDGAWRQLSDIFELDPYRLPDCTDAAEEEIGLTFKSLPSCPLKVCMPQDPTSGGRGGFCQRIGLLRVLFYSKGVRRSWWQILLLLLIIIGLAGAGVLFYLIPTVNKLLWRPAGILIVNPYHTTCTVTFDGVNHTLAANGSLTIPDIFGRMPRRSTLQFKHPQEAARQISVPLRGDETVLVNPMGMLFFGVVRTDLHQTGLSSAQLNRTTDELLAGRAPASALSLCATAKAYGENVLVAQTDAPFIYSTDEVVTRGGLNFQQLGLVRSPQDLEQRGPLPAPPSDRISRNLLPGVRLGDVSIHYRKGSTEVAECSYRLNITQAQSRGFCPATRFGRNRPMEYRWFEPVWGGATCTVAYTASGAKVTVHVDKKDCKILRHQRTLLGRWSYEGIFDKHKNSWTWSWRFQGNDRIRVAFLDMTVLHNGKITAKYHEKRGKR